MHKAYLSLGSNIGNKVDYLDKAVDILKKNKDIHNLKVSHYYQTDPVGYLDQDVFVNIAVYIETNLSPLALLDVCQSVETALDRIRVIRWGPRTIDVDIICMGEDMVTERLILPHPRAHERAFVLVPINELNPALKIGDKAVNQWLENVDTTGVRKI